MTSAFTEQVFECFTLYVKISNAYIFFHRMSLLKAVVSLLMTVKNLLEPSLSQQPSRFIVITLMGNL